MKELLSRLTWVDYLALIAVLRGCYVGYRSGFFSEILRIAAYLAAAVVTFWFYEPLSQWITLKTFLNLASATAVSVFLLLAGVFCLSKLLAALILKLIKIGEGDFFQRVLGLAVGACRWLVLLSFLYLAVDHSPLASLRSDIRQRSMTGPTVARIAPAILDFLSNVSPRFEVEGGAG